MTKKLENEMVNLLAGLREMQHDQAEKWEKKTWTNIDIPFTLPERLHTYTKSDLDEIRKFLRIKGASSLKKAELISRLKKAIPLFLRSICLQWDNERFTLLTKIAHHGGYMIAPEFTKEQINYLRKSGIIYCGTFQGNKILALPDELIEPIKVLEKDENVTNAVARNTEWIKLTRGLLYYNGTLSISELTAMVKKYTKEPIEILEYIEVMYDANSYQKELQIAHDGFSNIRVFDAKRVKQEHRQRESLSFYPFSKNQLLQAGEPGFVERNKSYICLVNFLTLNYEISKAEADKIVEECVYAIQIGESPNDIMQFLSQSFIFEDMEDVQELMGMVVELMNNTKEWFLKGHSPTEIMAFEKETLIPLPVHKPKQRVTKINEKIGRNDPCPCGSGKKYKKCCGQ